MLTQRPSGISLYGVNPNYKNAYIESFNLNVQQALPWGMVAQLYYDGSVGRHLEVESNINQVVGATSATQVHPVHHARGHQPHPARRRHRLQHRLPDQQQLSQTTTRCGQCSART